jgi:hypothetical protein
VAQHKNRRVRPELGEEEPELEPIIRVPNKRITQKQNQQQAKKQAKLLREQQKQSGSRKHVPPPSQQATRERPPAYAGEYGAMSLLDRPAADNAGVGPASGGDPLAPRRKSRRLARLWKRFGGACQRCGCGTMPLFVAERLGWEVFRPFGIVVAPDGAAYAIATVQHILSRALGGTNAIRNLTLYCYNCNLTDNMEVRRNLTLPVQCGADPLAMLANLESGLSSRSGMFKRADAPVQANPAESGESGESGEPVGPSESIPCQ